MDSTERVITGWVTGWRWWRTMGGVHVVATTSLKLSEGVRTWLGLNSVFIGPVDDKKRMIKGWSLLSTRCWAIWLIQFGGSQSCTNFTTSIDSSHQPASHLAARQWPSGATCSIARQYLKPVSWCYVEREEPSVLVGLFAKFGWDERVPIILAQLQSTCSDSDNCCASREICLHCH